MGGGAIGAGKGVFPLAPGGTGGGPLPVPEPEPNEFIGLISAQKGLKVIKYWKIQKTKNKNL
jgi:hypothetical protein